MVWTPQAQLFEYLVLRCWFRMCGRTGGALSLGVGFVVSNSCDILTFSYLCFSFVVHDKASASALAAMSAAC